MNLSVRILVHHLANGKWAIKIPLIPMHTAKLKRGILKLYFMKQLELNKMGLDPIGDLDLIEITGGNWTKWLKKITWIGVGKEIIDHWDEIKKGLKDGWNFDKQAIK